MPDIRPSPPATWVADKLKKAGYQVYFVGGCVRDYYRCVQPKDWDVATNAHPSVVRAVFELFEKDNDCRVVPTGEKYGTLTIVRAAEPIEVTTFRGDGVYEDGRRPTSVQYVESIEDDLARRDFTFNAMAMDPFTLRVIDPFGGYIDLMSKIVRCVGNPRERFMEDSLRMLRAVRFAAVLGAQFDPVTWREIKEYHPRAKMVAAERRAVEFVKTLMADDARRTLEWVWEDCNGLFEAYGLSDCSEDLDFLDLDVMPKNEMVRLASIFRGWHAGDAQEVMINLKLSREHITKVPAIIQRMGEASQGFKWSAQRREWLSKVRQGGLDTELLLDMMIARGWNALVDRLSEDLALNPPLTVGDLAIKGEDVIQALGAPGPKVGQVLKRLLHDVIDQPHLNTKPHLERLVRRYW